MPLPAYVNVWRLIEMFSLICNMLQISAGACSVIILWHSLLMQPHQAILQSLIYHVLQLFMGKSRLFQLSMHAVLYLSSFCGTRKEVHMEIHEALSFYHSRVKYMTLQELLANNTQSLIRDSKKIAKKSRVIKNECKVWVELYRSYTMCTHGLCDMYTLSPWACSPQALSVYIRQTTRAHGITIKYAPSGAFDVCHYSMYVKNFPLVDKSNNNALFTT